VAKKGSEGGLLVWDLVPSPTLLLTKEVQELAMPGEKLAVMHHHIKNIKDILQSSQGMCSILPLTL